MAFLHFLDTSFVFCRSIIALFYIVMFNLIDKYIYKPLVLVYINGCTWYTGRRQLTVHFFLMNHAPFWGILVI